MTDADIDTLEQTLVPLSESVLDIFPEFDPCVGSNGASLVYNPETGNLEPVAGFVPADSICWHAKTEGTKHNFDNVPDK